MRPCQPRRPAGPDTTRCQRPAGQYDADQRVSVSTSSAGTTRRNPPPGGVEELEAGRPAPLQHTGTVRRTPSLMSTARRALDQCMPYPQFRRPGRRQPEARHGDRRPAATGRTPRPRGGRISVGNLRITIRTGRRRRAQPHTRPHSPRSGAVSASAWSPDVWSRHRTGSLWRLMQAASWSASDPGPLLRSQYPGQGLLLAEHRDQRSEIGSGFPSPGSWGECLRGTKGWICQAPRTLAAST